MLFSVRTVGNNLDMLWRIPRDGDGTSQGTVMGHPTDVDQAEPHDGLVRTLKK
jgi:hypothetical protein